MKSTTVNGISKVIFILFLSNSLRNFSFFVVSERISPVRNQGATSPPVFCKETLFPGGKKPSAMTFGHRIHPT
jgi:hypothetical protein